MALSRLLLPLLCGILLCQDLQRASATTIADARNAAQSALETGLKYDLGEGVPGDSGEAYHWYLAAAKLGLPEAEFNVGVMNDSGTGTARDVAAAATWYARAAAHGYERARYNLALLYRNGQGVPQNPDLAAAWLHRAAPKPDRGKTSGSPPPALRAATLVTPGNGDALPAFQPRGRSIEFVWLAPAQPAPVRFFLEVVSIDNNTVADIFAQYVDQTSWLVDLPDRPAAYEWRVCAVSDTDYSVSPWNFFYQD